MLNYDGIMEALEAKIHELRIKSSSNRLPSIGDHDYIVGEIYGLEMAKEVITELRDRMEFKDDLDADEIEDGKYGAKIRKNTRRSVPRY